jgi:macrolide transport system ATP-binding/permease protein
LFVSHDRSFIRALADQIMTIEDGQIKMFQGSYEEYAEHGHQVAHGSGDSQFSQTSGDSGSVENSRNSQGLQECRGSDEHRKEILLLQHRLSEIISRISLPSKKDDVTALDREYQEILRELKRLKS